jgi:hypothetical protein
MPNEKGKSKETQLTGLSSCDMIRENPPYFESATMQPEGAPKFPNAAPTRILVTRNASAWQLTIACAPLEICLESVFIGSMLRCATGLRLPLAKTLWWRIVGEEFGKDWGPSREGAVDFGGSIGVGRLGRTLNRELIKDGVLEGAFSCRADPQFATKCRDSFLCIWLMY